MLLPEERLVDNEKMGRVEKIHQSLLPFVKDERVLQGSFPFLDSQLRSRIGDEEMDYINAYFATRTQKKNMYGSSRRTSSKSPQKNDTRRPLKRSSDPQLLQPID